MLYLANGGYSHVINPSGSNFDSQIERLTLLRVYGGGLAADVTAPILSLPTGTATSDTTGTGTVTTDEGNGTLYFWVTQNASETAADIALNGDSQSVTTTGVQNVSFSGLTAATTYYVHYVHDDASANRSNVQSSAAFITDAAVVAAQGGGGGIHYRFSRKDKTKKLFDEIEQTLKEKLAPQQIGLANVQTEPEIEKAVETLTRISIDYTGYKRRLKKINDEVRKFRELQARLLEEDDEDFIMMH